MLRALLSPGLAAAASWVRVARHGGRADLAGVLITGGAGFIGSQLARRLIGEGHRVAIFDNLARPGAGQNLALLRADPGLADFDLFQGDVRDFAALCRAAEGAERIYHLAGQVAVTSSIRDPRADFDANALGTLNALEAARAIGTDPIFLYSSTNKVYGALESLAIVEGATRYAYANLPHGVAESQPLDFSSPYGCSKGAADQYVRDYHRIYGVRTVVLRQSCIYGYGQFGVADQGWAAWLLIAALRGWPISIYGDGKQVRDMLFIDDLLDLYDAAIGNIDRAAGQIYNIGGGPEQTVSVWAEFGPLLQALVDEPIAVTSLGWRPADQRVYISDIRKAERELGWRPRVGVAEGLRRTVDWMRTQQALFDDLYAPGLVLAADS